MDWNPGGKEKKSVKKEKKKRALSLLVPCTQELQDVECALALLAVEGNFGVILLSGAAQGCRCPRGTGLAAP